MLYYLLTLALDFGKIQKYNLVFIIDILCLYNELIEKIK